MSTPHSPTRYNGYEDDPMFADAYYTQDINDRMRVPKRIKATGEYSDEDLLLSNQNGIMNSWNYNNKIDMTVPDRIVVMGHNQHLGTRSAPREILLENSILPKDPGFVRVATPPRVISMHEHNFPTASDDPGSLSPPNYPNSPPDYIRSQYEGNHIGIGVYDVSPNDDNSEQQTTTGSTRKSLNFDQNQQQLVLRKRDETPPLSEGIMLTPSEEVLQLRRQLSKLNRRVLSIEIDNVQRQQREKLIYCLGLAYFLLKAIFWMNKN